MTDLRATGTPEGDTRTVDGRVDVDVDVCVVGAGPAGLALASHLARLGITAAAVGPAEAWRPRYCLWLDEARALDAEPWIAASWARTVVHAEGQRFELGRPYAMLDNARAAAGLLALAGARLVRLDARCVDVTPAPDARNGVVVALAGGGRVRCRAWVDARGAGGGQGSAAQSAWGAVIAPSARVRVEGLPFDGPREIEVGSGAPAVLMCFSAQRGPREGGEAPSFLYALPRADGTVFLEETCLAGAPAMGLATLRARLAARLGAADTGDLDHGARTSLLDAAVDVERCFIPLDATPASGSFGAAAGLIHPCSGYSVATSLRLAPRVAMAIADALGRASQGDAQGTVVHEMDAVLFSKRRRRARALQKLGLDLLLQLDQRATGAFFAAVFSAPGPVWRTFLDGDPDPDALLAAMTSLFSALDRGVRRSLSRLVLQRHLTQVPSLVPALVSELARAVREGAR